MNRKFSSVILLIVLITIIPTVNAQFSLGVEANQKSIEIELTKSEKVNVKHVINSSNMPVTVNLFDGIIEKSIMVTNEEGEEKEIALLSDSSGKQSITIFPSKQNSIIEYTLEDVSTLYDNMWTIKIGYSETFSVLFSEEIDLFFINNNIILLEDKKGISVNGGGDIILQYYSNIPKIVEEIQWEEEKFNVEIITDSDVEKFNFDQKLKSISFQINEKNKFVTLNIEEKLLDGPYFVLLNDEKIQYSTSLSKENYVVLSMKPQVVGEIVISGSEYTNGLNKNTSNDTLPVESESIPNDYFIWLILGSILIIVAIVVIIIMRKIKK